MPTAELTYDQVEAIVHEAAEIGHLSHEQVQALQAFLALVERKVFDVYQADRLVASRMYDRVKIAEFWQHEFGWFQSQHEILNNLAARLQDIGLRDLDPEPTLELLADALEAVRGHYELHS
jgi:hypothetical protein